MNRTNQRRPTPFRTLVRVHARTGLAVAAVLSMIGFLRLALPAWSATITPGANQKVTVYQGVAIVAPGDPGASIMEIGNAGRDIASTGSIFLRPNSTGSGTRFYQCTAGSCFGLQNLDLTGDLTIGKDLCFFGGDCRSSWPPGTTEWKLINVFGPVLQPKVLTNAVHVGSPGSPVQGGPALNVAAPGGVATYVNRGSGYAGLFDGNVSTTADVKVYGTITSNGRPVWDASNDGQGSGLDAGKIDGMVVRYETPDRCTDGRDQQEHLYCLCFSGRQADGITPLPGADSLGRDFYRCAPLFNYF
ncbi:MAG: hypothetical protein HY420_02975 [Candidatus Kerfeldbacteria bacterium]|nr:hypothetical protein [Candidatus Kerfeldbacteria bacterium]